MIGMEIEKTTEGKNLKKGKDKWRGATKKKKGKKLTGKKEKLLRKNKWIGWKENEGEMEGRHWERKKMSETEK